MAGSGAPFALAVLKSTPTALDDSVPVASQVLLHTASADAALRASSSDQAVDGDRTVDATPDELRRVPFRVMRDLVELSFVPALRRLAASSSSASPSGAAGPEEPVHGA